MNFELKICKKKSKEKGTEFCALVIDMGYKMHYLSVKLTDIAEFLNVRPLDAMHLIDKLEVGQELKVGSVEVMENL